MDCDALFGDEDVRIIGGYNCSEEQQKLTHRLDIASVEYYKGNTTEFTDAQFDLELKKLQQMEEESGVVLPFSPTLRVGSDLQSGFSKVTHPIPMLTIDNVYDDSEFANWISKHRSSLNISVKYDGVSCELHYKEGILSLGSTRGDKNIGDNITLNVRTIKDVPLRLNGVSGDFYVRGEIMLPKSRLSALNEERTANNEQPFANCRNACTGSIKQLDPKVTAKRGLIFRAWDCYFLGEDRFNTMDEKFSFLKGLGFVYEEDTFPFSVGAYDDITSVVNSFYERLKSSNLDYDFDGIVIKHNSIAEQKVYGTKDTRAIEWGIARKWNEDRIVTTRLNHVIWSVGAKGNVTPVGMLEPVECDGVTITNVSLHNPSFVYDLGLKYGDIIRITRSGGVIPYVLGVERHASADEPIENRRSCPECGNDVVPPRQCPECGSLLLMDGDVLKCTNEMCPAQVKGLIQYFCSKDCMDIMSIGPAVITDLCDKMDVKNYIDLYEIAKDEENVGACVEKLGYGYGEKSVRKMFEEINKSKSKPLDKLIASLGIKGVSKVTGRLLASTYKTLEAFSQCTEAQLESIPGIGEVTASDIAEWVRSDFGQMAMSYFLNAGFKTVLDEGGTTAQGDLLSGLSVVYSGSSAKFKGDTIEEYLESMGAKCGHSVSKKTNYLIIGEKPGPSKVTKAKELGVEVITEKEFFDKYGLC